MLDTKGAHTATRLMRPDTIGVVLLPPYTPAVTPIARVWRDINDEVGWQQFTDGAAHQPFIRARISTSAAPALPSLTASAYVVEAVNARCP